jgi:hypothetical protein
MGRTSVEIYGNLEVKCKQNNTCVKLEFKEHALWNKKEKQVIGFL